MKAKLTFDIEGENNEIEYDLDDACERAKLKKALAADDIIFALWDYDNWLRNQIKHCNREEFQEVRDALHEQLESRGLALDHLIV